MVCSIKNTVSEWCRDYLRNRQQCVKVENNVSGLKHITYGVPQGSILGTLFFIMYVNDIICNFRETDPNIVLYADDTVIYYQVCKYIT